MPCRHQVVTGGRFRVFCDFVCVVPLAVETVDNALAGAGMEADFIAARQGVLDIAFPQAGGLPARSLHVSTEKPADFAVGFGIVPVTGEHVDGRAVHVEDRGSRMVVEQRRARHPLRQRSPCWSGQTIDNGWSSVRLLVPHGNGRDVGLRSDCPWARRTASPAAPPRLCAGPATRACGGPCCPQGTKRDVRNIAGGSPKAPGFEVDRASPDCQFPGR